MKRLSFSKRMIFASITAFFFAAAAFGSVRASEITLESDTFTQNPGFLNDRPVENPQSSGDVWNTANTPSTNDIVGGGQLQLDNSGFAKAVDPFDATGIANPYTLHFTLTFNPGTNSAQSFYGGFGNGTGKGTSFSDYTDALDFNLQNDTTGTSATLYGEAGGNAYDKTLSTTITRASTSVPYDLNLAISYNPTTDLATYFVDGSSIGTASYSGQVGGVWMKGNGVDPSQGSTGFQISNFSITETVPEPSTYALLAAGAAGLAFLAARRRKA